MNQNEIMNYQLLQEVVDLLKDFESNRNNNYSHDIVGFQHWISDNVNRSAPVDENLEWEGKADGRSMESAIATSLVHLNRYARNYSKAAIQGSAFSTQDEFVYLIQLKAKGDQTKMELIKRNIQEKAVGVQIINRLIQRGWVVQQDSKIDKRSKIISITKAGLEELEAQMGKIRLATSIVSGNLNGSEKSQLFQLLSKLDHFHQEIFQTQIPHQELLEFVNEKHLVL